MTNFILHMKVGSSYNEINIWNSQMQPNKLINKLVGIAQQNRHKGLLHIRKLTILPFI